MVTQNETFTSSVVPYSPDILDDLPIDDQLAVEFFATARCASFKQAARGLNVPVVAGVMSLKAALACGLRHGSPECGKALESLKRIGIDE